MLLLGVSLLASTAAHAEAPAVVIAKAPIVSPATALSYYGSPASPAAAATRDPVIQELARSLRYDIDRIFEHVRDHVEFVPIFGVQKGARGVVLDGYGTAFDQAQFLVEALRESDAAGGRQYNPSYVMGQITLSASDFTSWTGVADAAIATKLLANGGIPATVTGSGNSFTVVMEHIWVKATVDGTAYLFDPSFKQHVAVAGLNWKAATGYAKADLLAAGGGATATVVDGFNDTAFRQKLTTYRANAEAFIATNAAGKRADALVGYRDIIPHPQTENRRTTLPYAVGAPDRLWAGQIPDAFRASFSVALNGATYGTYFADAVGEQVRQFNYYFNTGSNTFQFAGTPAILPVIEGSYDSECANYLGGQAAVAPAIVSITINHPYAANAGSYADRVLSKQLVGQRCATGTFFITNDWGYTGSGTSSRMALASERLSLTTGSSQTMMIGRTLAHVASQYSQFLDLAGRAQNSAFLVHDLIGLHTIDEAAQKMDTSSASVPGQAQTYTVNAMLTMDFEAAVSALSVDGTQDAGAAFTAGLGLSLAEGAVPRQETDAVYDMAAVNLLTQQQARAPSGDIYPTYLATPATWSSVKTQLAGDYPPAAVNEMQGYINEGYSLLAPRHGSLRQPTITVTDATYTRTATLIEGLPLTAIPPGPELTRSAFLAWKSTGSIADRVALVVYDPRHGRILKGGVGVAKDPLSQSIRSPDIPKAESAAQLRGAASIDGKSGAFNYAPPPDLVDGTGDFPRSLSFQRAYDQNEAANYGLGFGWKTNWNQTAVLSNNGEVALGSAGAQAIGSALVAIQALSELTATQDAQHLYAAAQVVAWLGDQSINNSVVVTPGLDKQKTFYRQAGGNFVSADADGEVLAQTGVPITGIINRRLYHPVTVNYTDGGGSIRTYPHALAGSSLTSVISSPNIAGLFSPKSLRLSTWSFPTGVKISTLYYNTLAAPDVVGLYSVTNNLGASIIADPGPDSGSGTRQPVCTNNGNNNDTLTWLPARPATTHYKTSGNVSFTVTMGAQVIYNPTNINFEYGCNHGQAFADFGDFHKPVTAYYGTSNVISSTDSAGATWAYGLTRVGETNPYYYGGYVVLDRLYKASNTTNPALTLSYGQDANVRSLTDLNGKSWTYYSSQFRSETLSPTQAAANPANGAAVYYDRWGQGIRSVDPLLRTTSTRYNDFGRVVETYAPEGNSEQIDYDVRGNIVQRTQHAKPGTGLPDLVTKTGYVGGPTLATCSSLTTCNKPAYVIDALDHRISYSWDATHGQLLTASSGLNAAGTCLLAGGTCPVTTIGYGSFAGTAPLGGTLYLPISKQEPIAAGSTTTTSFEYDSANKFAMKGQVVDNGGLALRTCYKFDAAGRLIAKTDPNAGLTSCQ